jgi:adenylate kinase family enzyme
MQRVVVLGASGCGKSTMARALASHLNLPYVEIDALQWGPNWTAAPTEILRSRVEMATAGDRWVVDGNYSKIRDAIWPRADTLIWLDYPMSVNFWRIFRRTVRRCITHEKLWHGNVESWATQFLSGDSLFLWMMTSWRRHRREYPKLFRAPECEHLRIHRFAAPAEAENWLGKLTGGASDAASD